MRIVMMGTGTFAEPTFEALLAAKENVVGLVTQPERETGRKGGSTRQTGKGMTAIAQAAGVPVAQPESINTPDGVAQLRAFDPDLLVVAAYGQILSKDVISTPKYGAINVHASLLPKYRGASPVAHAILNGESETGVTIIRITPGLDAGEMLAKESMLIGSDVTTGELESRLAPIGARLAIRVIEKMKVGPVSGEKQDPTQVTKAPKLKKEDGLIDWSKPAELICRQVRAMQPWPTAYTFFHRPEKQPIRLIVCRIASTAATSYMFKDIYVKGELSEVALPDMPTLLSVNAGNATFVLIGELQPAGKKRMSAEEFLRGHPIQDGYRFGPERLP